MCLIYSFLLDLKIFLVQAVDASPPTFFTVVISKNYEFIVSAIICQRGAISCILNVHFFIRIRNIKAQNI